MNPDGQRGRRSAVDRESHAFTRVRRRNAWNRLVAGGRRAANPKRDDAPLGVGQASRRLGNKPEELLACLSQIPLRSYLERHGGVRCLLEVEPLELAFGSLPIVADAPNDVLCERQSIAIEMIKE